jgi:hypothetical protein
VIGGVDGRVLVSVETDPGEFFSVSARAAILENCLGYSKRKAAMSSAPATQAACGPVAWFAYRDRNILANTSD